MQLHKKVIKQEVNWWFVWSATGWYVLDTVCLSFILSLGYKNSYFPYAVRTSEIIQYYLLDWCSTDARFGFQDIYLFYDVAKLCLECQGQAIKIIIKNNDNKQNLMFISHFHFSSKTPDERKFPAIFRCISSSIDYDC